MPPPPRARHGAYIHDAGCCKCGIFFQKKREGRIMSYRYMALLQKSGRWSGKVRSSSTLRHIFFVWGTFIPSCMHLRGVMMMRELSWWLDGSNSSLPTVQSRKLISGLQRLWVGGGLHMRSVRFCDAPRRVSWCCQISSSSASGTPSPRYLKSAIYWKDIHT